MNGLGSYMTQGLRGLEAKVPPPLMFMLVGGLRKLSVKQLKDGASRLY